MAGRVNEESTAIYSAQLVDELGANIALASIATITLTLYDEYSGAIINGRNGQDIKNANNVTISSTGAVSWTLQPADNTVVHDSFDTETHVALFQGTYGSGGLKSLKHEFRFRVVNLEKVS